MASKTNNSRPNIPYNPVQSLPNNDRFSLLGQRPPTAEMFDAEFNALTDDINTLASDINAAVAGNIPGSNTPENANKVLITDGAGNLSFVEVGSAQLADNAVTAAGIAPQAVTTPKIGDGAVTNAKIAPNAINTNQMIDTSVTTAKIVDSAITTAKLADATVTTAKVAHQAITQAQIANAAIGTNQIINANVTTGKIADGAITTAKLDPTILPPGTINCSAAINTPAGWLYCDGSAIKRVAYAALFRAIGITYGAGDGSTTFNLPDLRGRMIAGIGNNTGNPNDTAVRITNATANAVQLGGQGGEERHQLTVNELAAHTHGYKQFPTLGNTYGQLISPITSTLKNLNTETTGGDQPHNNMSPFLLLKYLIKT